MIRIASVLALLVVIPGAHDGDSTELLFMATLSNDGLVFGSDAVSITGTKKNKK